MENKLMDRQKFLMNRFGIHLSHRQKLIALAGNPNVGKSTIFNALTGLRQHTGNWPGKTVDSAQGSFTYEDEEFLLIDLPGTYSILSHTAEEEIAREFLCFGMPDAILVVVDASCLERNLNLALQVLEISANVLLCVNLIDEAEKKGITVDRKALGELLHTPVICTAARNGKGIDQIKSTLLQLLNGNITAAPQPILYSQPIENAISQLMPQLSSLPLSLRQKRWLALRLLEGNAENFDEICTEANSWIKN